MKLSHWSWQGFSLILPYLLLSTGVFWKQGIFSRVALLLVGGGFLTLLWLVLSFGRFEPQRSHPTSPLLGAALIFFLLLGMSRAPGLYHTPTYTDMVRLLWGAALLLTIWLLLQKEEDRPQRRLPLSIPFLLLIGIAFIAKVGMVRASPRPIVDVWVMLQDAPVHLMAGKNPYTMPVPNIYAGTPYEAQGWYVFEHYPYPPLTLWLTLPARWLLGDVRFLMVLAELGTALLLFALTCPRRQRKKAELLAALYLFNPVALHIVEQSYTEPLLNFFFAASMLLWVLERRLPAALAAGGALSLKQYMVCLLPLLWMVELRWKQWALMVGVVLVSALPFLAWDARALYENAFLVYVTKMKPRADALSVSGFVLNYFDVAPPQWLVLPAVAAAIWFSLRRLPHNAEGAAWAAALVFYTFFLFSKQAFANHWHFVGLCLLTAVALELASCRTSKAGSEAQP